MLLPDLSSRSISFHIHLTGPETSSAAIMNVNKKFDRLKQWGKERMGGEVRTDTSDEFKSLEVEMQLRQEGKGCACRFCEHV